MRTSYPEFYQYLLQKKYSPLLEQMKKEIKEDKELWSDMEEALGNYTDKIHSVGEMDSLHKELSECLQEYLQQVDSQFAPSAEMKSKGLSDFLHPDKYLEEIDRDAFNSFFTPINNKTENDDYEVISLNYTNTFEKLIGNSIAFDKNMSVKLNNVYHVHGRLGDTIIIGVDNADQIKNVSFRYSDEISSFLVKKDANTAMKNNLHTLCKQLIEKANLVVLFGVSFGKTDIHWWKTIGDELKKRKDIGVISFLYLPNELPVTRRFRLAAVEERERQRIYSKMDLNYYSTIKDINDRFFIAINSSMFNYKKQ